jgi:hypothetical protein
MLDITKVRFQVNSLKVVAVVLALATSSATAAEFKPESDRATMVKDNHNLVVESNQENVVASRLEGRWTVNDAISTRLGGRMIGYDEIVEFKADSTVLTQLSETYKDELADLTIYMAGKLAFNQTVYPFILIQLNGNPHVVFFQERDGNPVGDAESFNVMLAVAEETANDLLLLGGDFNNQPFTAFDRLIQPERDR